VQNNSELLDSDLLSETPITDDSLAGPSLDESAVVPSLPSGDDLLSEAIPGGAIDFSAFSSMPFDDALSNSILVMAMVLCMIIGLIVTGWSMKVACLLTRGRPISVLRGLIATIVFSVVYGVAAAGSQWFVSTPSPFLALAVGIAMSTLALALVVVQNPVRALFTGIIASVLQAMFAIGITVAAALVVAKFVPPAKIEQLAGHTESFTASIASEVLPGDAEANSKLLSLNTLVDSAKDSQKEPAKAKKVYIPGVRENPFVE